MKSLNNVTVQAPPTCRHLLAADDADAIRVLELLLSHVRVQRVHVVDGAAGQYDVTERLLERPGREVTGYDSWQRRLAV